MDSLKMQDAFEPYRAERNRVAVLPAKTDASLARHTLLPTNVRLSDNKPDSTTEH
ncbi:hypothetical protein NKH57_04195 [Mesorhizobium sp. M1050]|uniref:hypothetical protein n=1 Tax=Mesorhizobium sp. M1050 TaxID=2957051 RepID=UPI003338FD66